MSCTTKKTDRIANDLDMAFDLLLEQDMVRNKQFENGPHGEQSVRKPSVKQAHQAWRESSTTIRHATPTFQTTMLIPRYWTRLHVDLDIDGTPQPSQFLGSSNISVADAKAVALDRATKAQERIHRNDGRRAEEYEVSIREEIVKELSADAIVTRNRYGAEVLNCARLVMIDVDQAPVRGLWAQLFGLDKCTPKERMLKRIRDVASVHRDRSLGFRIYETHNGYRVLVTGRNMAPTDPTVHRLFDGMNGDTLYAHLCRRQDCFRARLTPKPSRMRLKAIRLHFPYDAETQEALNDWLPGYKGRSRDFSVCHLIDVIGSTYVSDAVRYHDERCCRGRSLPLA